MLINILQAELGNQLQLYSKLDKGKTLTLTFPFF